MTELDTLSPPVVVALTGASGAPYGLRLVERLLEAGQRVDLLLSSAARVVLRQECGLEWEGDAANVQRLMQDHFLPDDPDQANRLRHFGVEEWLAPMASGSARGGAMVICPCTMGTLAAVAQGMSDSLIERAADVTLKEGRTLILVPRETPLSALHLRNMLTLAELGAVILPAMPGFYHRPQRVEELVEFVVERIMSRLGLGDPRAASWPPAGIS